MDTYNYFFVEDLTRENLKRLHPSAFEKMQQENPYSSFLIEVEKAYYPDAFFFYNIETMLIRTRDDEKLVNSNLNKTMDECQRRQKTPDIEFEVQDAWRILFDHPDNEVEKFTAAELYAYYAQKHLNDTGIDFCAGCDPPAKYEVFKNDIVPVKSSKFSRSKIQILNNKTIQLRCEDHVLQIQNKNEKLSRVELKKTVSSYGPNSSIRIHQKGGGILTLQYYLDHEYAAKDFALLENLIWQDLPF